MTKNRIQPASTSVYLTRQDMRLRRRSLSQAQRNGFDHAICGHLEKLIDSGRTSKIAAYDSFDGEPNISPFCKNMLNIGNELALPVVSESQNSLMSFHAWQNQVAIKKNRYGINEPVNSPAIQIDDFDLLLLPLVAYDNQGSRIGMGAGYYDRHLEPLRSAYKPLRAGIAYSFQKLEEIEANPWDIPLHLVVTEKGPHYFDQD